MIEKKCIHAWILKSHRKRQTKCVEAFQNIRQYQPSIMNGRIAVTSKIDRVPLICIFVMKKDSIEAQELEHVPSYYSW
jgi:hypothetical protein